MNLILCLSQVIALMCGVWIFRAYGSPSNSLPAEIINMPAELLPLKDEIAAVYNHLLAADATQGRLLETHMARKTHMQRWLPILALQSGIDRGQRKIFSEQDEINQTSPQTRFQYGINLKQNIFSGGDDLKRGEILQLSETAAALRHQLAWKNVIKEWIVDAIHVRFYSELVKFSEEAHQLAIQLNQFAKRKESSGFLGKRDLLESEREVLRTSEEKQRNQSNLAQLTQTIFLRYGTRYDTASDIKSLEFLLRVSDKLLEQPIQQFVEVQSQKSLPLRIAQTERRIAEKDLSRTRSTRFTPSLDASAGFTESTELNASRSEPTEALNPSKSQQWSIALSGSLQLNPPVAFGAVDEALQKLLTAKQNETRTLREVSVALSGSADRLRFVLQRQKVTTKLVEATAKIREQNRRLFEAGEISLDRLILSQQDLDRDRKILVTLHNEENLLRTEIGLSALWDIPPNSSSATTP